jgi:hypothetical protein
MQYITIFHANLNYAYLTEDRYEFVVRRCVIPSFNMY